MKDGDIFIDPNTGKSSLIDGPSKTSQDVAEVLMTPLRRQSQTGVSTPAARREYGSELANIDVPAPLSLMVGKGLISIKVSEAINRLKSFQLADPSSTSDERISKISKLVVEPLAPGEFAFWVVVEVESGLVASERVLTVSLRHKQSAQALVALNEFAKSVANSGEVA